MAVRWRTLTSHVFTGSPLVQLTPSKDVRVLYLDDIAADVDPITRELEHAGLAISTQRVASELEFRDALKSFAPDIVLGEHSLSDLSAFTAMKILASDRPTAPMIIVTRSVEVPTSVALMRAGVEDIVLKNDAFRLAPAIEAAIVVRRPLRSLSPRQLEVLRLVADGETSPEISKHLNISVKTVETHRTELMRRIGVHDVVALVRYAMRVGLWSPNTVMAN
ncbi:MAG: two component transcriptional regulator, LuxR family [Gemmatimonadetes bacterium]|nr:two component transcriptional regulator, LuxR family [Gemmatimonadota bacterium]